MQGDVGKGELGHGDCFGVGDELDPVRAGAVRVAVGVFAEQAEPAFPAGFQAGRAVAGEPLPCLRLCLEVVAGDCCGAVAAGEPPVECVGVRDLGQQVLERALGSPAVPSAVPSADPLMGGRRG
jgi:hypothetical protein